MAKKKIDTDTLEEEFLVKMEDCYIRQDQFSEIYNEWLQSRNTSLAIVDWFIKQKLESMPNFRISIMKCNKKEAVKVINRLLKYGETYNMIISVLNYSLIDNFWSKNLFSISQLLHANEGKARKYEYIKQNLENHIRKQGSLGGY